MFGQVPEGVDGDAALDDVLSCALRRCCPSLPLGDARHPPGDIINYNHIIRMLDQYIVMLLAEIHPASKRARDVNSLKNE